MTHGPEKRFPPPHIFFANVLVSGCFFSPAAGGYSALKPEDDAEIAPSEMESAAADSSRASLVSELQGHDEWRDIPVVVVTAMDLPPEQRQMLEGHVKAVFHKGDYRLEGLLLEIRALVHANLGEERGVARG